MERTTYRHRRALLAIASAALTIAPGAATLGAAAQVCGTDDGKGCAPDSARVDLAPPAFSDPTNVTNPLHPSATLRSALLMGTVDDLPFRVEVTLLPEPKTIDVGGVPVQALESQYVAFLDGRIHEVALDWYAQADDGAVWYLGEDVFNYEDGVLADTEGTWMADRDGPAAMIMPASPQVGDVYRPENIPGLVFEEVTVKRTGIDVDGPSGSVTGAIEVDELHMEGTHETKLFAPDYGEFFTGSEGDTEAMALAVPTDALPAPVPEALVAIASNADGARTAAEVGDWAAAAAALEAIGGSWGTFRLAGVPMWLVRQMTGALDALGVAVRGQHAIDARLAAITVARAGLDLQLRHRDPASVDIDRTGLWLEQVLVHAAADDLAGVRGDVTTIEWTRDRIRGAIDTSVAGEFDAGLTALRASADAGDLAAAAGAAMRLRTVMVDIVTGA